MLATSEPKLNGSESPTSHRASNAEAFSNLDHGRIAPLSQCDAQVCRASAPPVGTLRLFTAGAGGAGGSECLAEESASALPNPTIERQCPCLAEGTGRFPRRSGGAAFCRTGQASRNIGRCRCERWGRETRVSLTPSMPFRPACRTSMHSIAIRVVGRPPKWHQPADVHPGEFRPAASLPSVCARGCQLGVGPGWDHQS